jgi:hypothetical protein
LCGIAYYYIVFKEAVVSDMTVSHYKAVAADNGFSFSDGTAIDGNTFPYSCTVAYLGGGLFAIEFKVLRDACYHSSGEYAAVVTYTSAVEYDDMWEDMAVVADNYVFFYHCERVDNHVSAYAGFGMDYR